MSRLEELEHRSIFVIREAVTQMKQEHLAALWSMGKDSTTLLWLIRKAFRGKVPFPIMHIDTSYKFPEMYAFRDRLQKEWQLDLTILQNKAALEEGMNHQKGHFKCCHALKTTPFQNAVTTYDLQGVFLAIRRDEHGVRGKERYFSPRDGSFNWSYQNQPPELADHFQVRAGEDEHLRIHPLLDWTEMDIWQYIEREDIPVNELYFAKNNKRYRSLGCIPCTGPVASTASSVAEIIAELATTKTSERDGRAQDKETEETMQKLRALGYM